MKKLVTLIAILSGLALNPIKAADGGVAIVDLDAVAKELGVLEFIAVTLDNMKVAKDAELNKMQQNLQAQMNKAIKDAGDKPSEDERRKVALTNRELETQFQQARAKAAQDIQLEKLKLINNFRNDLKPHALTVAKKKKLHVVLNKVMPPVYAFDDSVDITVELTAEAKKAGLAKKAPERKTQ
ncbi:MAG: OmpH family outer membrane protein [Verrucomicrobiales bacterium]|nr:OmpH family outer membrane protein [Verrucomicrobiales bacterium]